MGRLGKFCVLLALVAVAASARPGWAQAIEGESGDGGEHAAIAYVGAVMTSVVYLPVKVGYAALGSLVGGLAYLVSAGDTAAFFDVWRVTAEGTYIVTPSMLEGEEPVRFLGP